MLSDMMLGLPPMSPHHMNNNNSTSNNNKVEAQPQHHLHGLQGIHHDLYHQDSPVSAAPTCSTASDTSPPGHGHGKASASEGSLHQPGKIKSRHREML